MSIAKQRWACGGWASCMRMRGVKGAVLCVVGIFYLMEIDCIEKDCCSHKIRDVACLGVFVSIYQYSYNILFLYNKN